MIREIINFVKALEEDYPEVFKLNKYPSPGLHFWVELDEEGNWKNNDPLEGRDYVVYNGNKELNELHMEAIKYEEKARRLGNNMNKVLDKKKQIFSCSPFVVSYKLKSYNNDKLEGKDEEKVINLLTYYFDSAQSLCLREDDINIEKSRAFKNILPEVISTVPSLTIIKKNTDGENVEHVLLNELKDDDYLCFYLKGIPEEIYKQSHEKYLQQKLFNVNDFNSENEITSKTWGVSDFINGTGAKFTKKPYLQHKTSSFYKGLAGRIQAKDTVALNKFELLKKDDLLPNPLPIFIDQNEFKNNSEIVSIFNNEGERKLTYPQLLKSLFEKDEQRILGNYYLLNINHGVVNDFDFVSNFQYKLSNFIIENLFLVKLNGTILPTLKIHTIFGFENKIVTRIFNNALVKEKDNSFTYNYFKDIDPNYINGGYEIANLILKYRKAFYDYIYKSRKQAVTSTMFDDIMLTSINSDLKKDELKEGYHTKENSIKEKLNIWFSLYNKFNNNTKNRENMSNTFKNLLEKMKMVANDDHILIDEKNVGEFLFAAGQVIYFLLSKSKASSPTHALLEPFLQKSSASQLQNALANAINVYKHEISFYKNRFERLSSQVLAFETKENLKNYQRYLLSGYFAPSVIYMPKNEKEEQKENINN